MNPARRLRADEGRVGVFLAIAFLAVIIVIGITVDAAGKYRTMQQADNLAAEAARTGGQQIDIGRAVSGEGQYVDFPAAVTAVNAYLHDVPGVVAHEVDPVAGDQGVEVVVHMEYQTVMLSLFGFPSTIEVSGEAVAVLQTEP
ncbi:hypothetical protein O7632_03545 [Solwaraspora sp. WMMD406]|uniref:hypothetical protein n=1 Tax=Solwaraspora sp. WMMD406 TaxID=3016095 RepID=UPI002415D58B|nr:hypothetical protein [Solwaraspora sp. WMMD406]MDG4763187.1 hypothetical protein [Solwaraspora sp. WMMD406]